MALQADEVYEAGPRLDLDASWREEIGSRVDEILNGKVELGSFEETRARTHALLDELRK